MSDVKLYLQVMSQINGGREYFYPVNEISASFCKILNQKTLTLENLDDIEKLLGFKVSIMGRKKDSEVSDEISKK